MLPRGCAVRQERLEDPGPWRLEQEPVGPRGESVRRVGSEVADVEGLRINEIAEITGAPPGTVMTRVHRARIRLRGLLADVARARGYTLDDAA